MANRDYHVVHRSRNQDRDAYEAEYEDRRYRGDEYDYDGDYRGARRSGAGDVWERGSTRSDHGSTRQQQMALAPRSRHNTRSEYDFVQDRDDVYSRGSNVIVLDSRDQNLSEWEIVRPERTESGAIFIETGAPYRRRDGAERETEISRGDRDRPVGRSRSIVTAMREVRVTEDDFERRSVYGQGGRGRDDDFVEAPVASHRRHTSVRHDHSPESDVRRRSRSIVFHKSQIRHHDATEARHERPGAEAALAGQYLIGHRGERLDDDYDGHASQVGPARPSTRDRSRRRRSRYQDDDVEYDYERRDRYYEAGVNRDFEQRSRPYSPQRAPSPEPEAAAIAEPERRHRRHRRRHRQRDEDKDEEGSYVSEHYRRVEKKYRD